MNNKILTTLIAIASMVMFATVSIAIDTVPLPDKPVPSYRKATSGSSSPKMIGTWPTPERPKAKYSRNKRKSRPRPTVRRPRR